jgi:hypothetical protein
MYLSSTNWSKLRKQMKEMIHYIVKNKKTFTIPRIAIIWIEPIVYLFSLLSIFFPFLTFLYLLLTVGKSKRKSTKKWAMSHQESYCCTNLGRWFRPPETSEYHRKEVRKLLDSARKLRKSMEHGSSIPLGIFLDFFRWFPVFSCRNRPVIFDLGIIIKFVKQSKNIEITSKSCNAVRSRELE